MTPNSLPRFSIDTYSCLFILIPFVTPQDRTLRFAIPWGRKGSEELVWMADDRDRLFKVAPAFVDEQIEKGLRPMRLADGGPVVARSLGTDREPQPKGLMPSLAITLGNIESNLRRIADHFDARGEAIAMPSSTSEGILTNGSEPSGKGLRRASPYLQSQEAADYLGITVKSLYGLVERQQLVPLRGPKRTYRFTTEILDDYIWRHERKKPRKKN